jgi:hypothetical protein
LNRPGLRLDLSYPAHALIEGLSLRARSREHITHCGNRPDGLGAPLSGPILERSVYRKRRPELLIEIRELIRERATVGRQCIQLRHRIGDVAPGRARQLAHRDELLLQLLSLKLHLLETTRIVQDVAREVRRIEYRTAEQLRVRSRHVGHKQHGG